MSGPSRRGSAAKLLKTYRILCAAFAAFLALYAVARIALLRAEHQDEARAGFQSVRAAARTAMAAFEARDDAYFASGMKEIVRGQPGIDLLAVHETGRVYYFFARRGDIFPAAPQPTADMISVPAYRSPALSSLRLVSSFTVGTQSRTFTVEALFTVLQPEDLRVLGKEAIYILLVFAILTATIALVVMVKTSARPLQRAAGSTAARRSEPSGTRYEPRTDTASPSLSASEQPGSSASEAPLEPAREEIRQPPPPFEEPVPLEIDELDLAAPEEGEPVSTAAAPAAAPRPARAPEAAARPVGAPEAAARDAAKSFYSDASGLVYRDFLASRLRSEIDRAAASDQDMVIAIVGIDHWEEISRHDLVYAAIAARLREAFPYRDLVFEHESGYAAIIPDINLDKALERFEDLRQRIEATPLEGKSVTVSVGIAARNGRLISEETLLKEASHSLAKALRDGANQVVAFRANPDKFRRVLAT